MASENAGVPKDVNVRLETGEEVTVGKLTVGDLGAIAGCIRDSAPDVRLSDFDDSTIAQAIISLAARLPNVMPPLIACATKRSPEETAKWSPHDSMKVLRAMLKVNDWCALIKDVKDFFSEVMTIVEAASESPAGSKP